MKKIIGVLPALILVLALVIPVQASNSDDGSMVADGSSVNYTCLKKLQTVNEPPVILQSTLLVQIINEDGVAWGWQGGGLSGYREAPYAFEGETIHFELDVVDTNGERDLQDMEVKITMASGLELLCGLDSLALSPSVPLSYGHYSGDILVDADVVQGIYDVQIDATDPDGATDTYDPALYQGTKDILVKPDVSLDVVGAMVAFPVVNPGNKKVPANENPIGLCPQAVIGTEHVPVLFTLYQVGTDMTCNSGIIPVDDIIWSLSNQGNYTVALSSSQQEVAVSAAEGQITYVYYWLNVPPGQADGEYQGKISYDFVAY